MKIRSVSAALFVLGIAPTAALAQFDFFDDGPPPKAAWEQFKLNPKTRVKLDFRNANIDAVLQFLSQTSGVTIIKDPTLTGGMTLQSPKPQPLTEAFALLNAVLGLKNFDLKKEGNFLVVRARAQRAAGGRGGAGGFPNFGGAGGFGGFGGISQPALKVYPIKYANASQVARVINEVFANSGQNLMQQMFGGGVPGAAGGNAAPAGPPPAPGARADAPPEGGVLVAAQQGGFGGGGGRRNQGGFGGGGFGGFGGGGFGGFGGFGNRGGANSSVVRASADDFSNSVIVNAPTREQEQVGRLIEQIDKQTEQPQQSRVFILQYASATDLAPVVQNVLVSNAPRGRGGIGTQNVPIDQRFQAAARFGSAQASFGQVIADARTNSLVVTGTQENLEIVQKVIRELDKQVSFESSTVVMTLENARADLIADLLNQSFNSRNGTGRNRTGQTGTGQNRNNQNSNNQNSNAGGLGGGLGGGARGGPNNQVNLELADPDAEAGELATTVAVQQGGGFGQFFGGGFGAGGGNRNQTTRTTGLDAQGRVVNVRDLSGQVIAIPDINTNSVILVTSPENQELLKQILAQLDKIPEQVMIETLIVEASLDTTNKLGVEWNFNQGKVLGDKNEKGAGSQSFGNQANTGQPQGLRYTLTGPQYGAFLQALQTDSRFDVLSTPRIFTSNNSTAEINISQSLPYVLSQRTDVNGNLTFNYAFLDVGIILTVTPRITSNGYVTMDVTQTANDFVRYTEFNAPVVNQREAQTTVSVRDGETIVLGGIIKNSVSSTVNKLPLLGDLPVLGNLFKSNSTTRNKTELLVFLTPRVVRDADEARKLREETEKKLDKKTQEKVSTTRSAPAPPPSPKP